MSASGVTYIGDLSWSYEDMRAELEAFRGLFDERPIRDNSGGMRAPHLFLTFYILRKLNPTTVIESGVWKGQGTWIIERAVPDAQIYCLDPELRRLQYTAKNATYSNDDFSVFDAGGLDPDRTVCFFDDHQNALARLQAMKFKGLKHAIFEDNYAPGVGDCYSLKKALAGAGNAPEFPGLKGALKKQILNRTVLSHTLWVPPNATHRKEIQDNLEYYWEGPPIFPIGSDGADSGNATTAQATPPALLDYDPKDALAAEARIYNWLCYAKLR